MSDDAELLRRALEKQKAGKPLNQREQRALERRQWAQVEQMLERGVPKRYIEKWTGRPTKILHEQAIRYQLPLQGSLVSLPALLRAYHDLLSRYKRQLSDGEESESAESNSPAIERLRMEQAKIARIKRRELQRQLLRRDVVHQCLLMVAGAIRQAGEKQQRLEDERAFEIHEAMLQAVEKAIEQFLDQAEYGELRDEIEADAAPSAPPVAHGKKRAAGNDRRRSNAPPKKLPAIRRRRNRDSG